MRTRRCSYLPALFIAVLLGGCDADPEAAHTRAAPDAEFALEMMDVYGCGTCHVIPGLRSARGKAGPPLTAWADRDFVAGAVPNTPENLVRWIVDPDVIEPGTAMPDLGVSAEEAHVIAEYLFTLTARGGEDD